MKLIIQNNLISATATDAYQPTGNEQAVIAAPTGFDQTKMAYYSYANGTVTLNSPLIEYESLIAGGIVLTSTGTPALNATYSTTDTAQKNVGAVVTGIAAGLGLPGGGTTFQYLDALNVPHSFYTSHFTAFAAALRNFVYNCEIALATIQSGGTATFPSNLVTIS